MPAKPLGQHQGDGHHQNGGQGEGHAHVGETAAPLGGRHQIQHGCHQDGGERPGHTARQDEQHQQLLAVLHQGAGHQQQKTQGEQHQQGGLAIDPIEPGGGDEAHQGGPQSGAAAEVAGLLRLHAEADDQIRPERHHHHHAAHGEHVDQQGKVDGGGGGGHWLHQRQARKNETELYPSDFFVTTNGNHFYLCYLIYLRSLHRKMKDLTGTVFTAHGQNH